MSLREAQGADALLGLAAICTDGLAIRADGAYVRYLELAGVPNPLALESSEAERISTGFAHLAGRLPDQQSLQLYVRADALELEEILAIEAQACEQAAGAALEASEDELALAIRRLGVAQEQTLRDTAQRTRPLSLRYLVICPWRPSRALKLRRTHALEVREEEHERALSESLRHTEGLRADLEAIDLVSTLLDGPAVLDLLHGRFDPGALARGEPPASFMTREAICAPRVGESISQASARAKQLACGVSSAPIDLSQRSHVQIGECLERVLYVSHAPAQTWLGWLLHLMQSPRPFTLSVHVKATARYRERMAQRRRYRRIYGVNRGVEQRGRPLDPGARLAEEEAAELEEELATSAGAGVYQLSIYAAIQEPDGDLDALSDACESAGRELTMACDAKVQHGAFAQARLWRSTLPLGLDVAARRRRYVTRNVGDSFPLTGSSCSSPEGIPLGFALPGRTLERLDPFDPVNGNHLMLVNGMMGAGKTMLVILLLIRALARGASGCIIDRAGHFRFLAALIPGAASVQVAGDAHAINAWDVEDPAKIQAEKVDYLLALHALLLGEHHAGRDTYGLSDLESNLLGLAIGEVYARCAQTHEEPRELLLQEELERRYRAERKEGSVGIAEALRDLSMRLNNYVSDGPYSYLTDRPTTIPPGGALVVFDTQSIPEAKAPAALFVICEHIKQRIAAARAEHWSGRGPRHQWSGKSFLIVDEAWKLIERPSTGRWFNDFTRRSRHFGLWVIAISQQLSDFDCEHGRALLKNARVRAFVRQEARELHYVRDALGVGEEAIEAIAGLQTYRGQFSLVYLMNGARGEATIKVGVGALEYWIATSEPIRDEPLRRLALRESHGDPWRALELLIDPDWQSRALERLEAPA